KAQEVGAEYLATGHYARIAFDQGRNRYVLQKGIDTSKDQSYALYHLNQHTLAHFLMPLGEYTKVQTREMAREIGLAVADKPDSQEICFVPDDDYKRFLEDRAPGLLKPGNFVNLQGEIIGRHQGLPLYTVGQRKGLGIAAGRPLYVVALDYERNEVILGENQDVFASAFVAHDLNWITLDRLEAPFSAQVKIRYGAKESTAFIEPLGEDKVLVTFKEPQRAITPGQSAVFYEQDTVIGGGIIEKVKKDER
ncbi:MAG: tRNA 2-thiouridine(34) synthase MnmA, partial [Sporomusaceae bacterium]|nr:tRNA 2-thiouridine(34) synthase MnmA [Sporomusaceae bacterium]